MIATSNQEGWLRLRVETTTCNFIERVISAAYLVMMEIYVWLPEDPSSAVPLAGVGWTLNPSQFPYVRYTGRWARKRRACAPVQVHELNALKKWSHHSMQNREIIPIVLAAGGKFYSARE